MKKTLILILALTQVSYAWRLDTYNSRKGLDVIGKIETPQECETIAKIHWDEYKAYYSGWERDHMQFSTKCTAISGKTCYMWMIKCPNIVCTTDKYEGIC